MSADYARASRSQSSIGIRLAKLLKSRLKGSGDVVDLGCGPGNVTLALQKILGKGWRVHGVDADRSAVARARKSHPSLSCTVGSIYVASRRRFDAAFSNEVWHWMPALPASFRREKAIHYYGFSAARRRAYARWALAARESAFRSLYRALKPGGVAALQFGRDGQLEKTYRGLNACVVGLFPRRAPSIKFPVYYGPGRESSSAARKAGFRVLLRREFVEDLKEKSPKEITAFVRGYAEPRLAAALGRPGAARVLSLFERSLKAGHGRREWRRLVLVLQRPKTYT
jgi:SAM-dependent methyltransferase